MDRVANRSLYRIGYNLSKFYYGKIFEKMFYWKILNYKYSRFKIIGVEKYLISNESKMLAKLKKKYFKMYNFLNSLQSLLLYKQINLMADTAYYYAAWYRTVVKKKMH